MPTLDLYTPSTHPDGWRQVRAPGGYECWLFEAHSEQLRLTVGLWLGHPENPAYATAVRQYLKRPTHTLPPNPSEYPTLTVDAKEGSRVIERIFEHGTGGDFRAACDRVDVELNDCNLTGPDGDYLLQVNAFDNHFYAGLTLGGGEVSKSADDGPHHALTLVVNGAVEGEVRLAGRDIEFAGRGSHWHVFGTRYPADVSGWLASLPVLSSAR